MGLSLLRKRCLSAAICVFLINIVTASHFRGGIIMWKPVTINSTMAIINVTLKEGFRRSYSTSHYCDASTIAAGNKPIGDGSMTVTPGTFLVLFEGVYCTDFSAAEDWSYGERTYPVRYNAQHFGTNLEIVFAGGAWITLLNGGSNWNLVSRVNLEVQSHTNRINSSPITTMLPLIRIQGGCYTEVKIPVQDPDGDLVKCRWSKGTECGDSCTLPNSVTLDEINCILKFNLVKTAGFYALRLQIEDFANSNYTKALSSIPLEFLVEAFVAASCPTNKPTFMEPTKLDQTCVRIDVGSTYRDIIVVNSNDNSIGISEIQTVSPPGMIKSPLYFYNNSLSIKYVNLTWTPTTSGVSILCFLGITTSLLSTEQRCISLAVGFTPPKPIFGTYHPTGIIYSNQTQWIILADQNLTTPRFPSFMKFFENETSLLVYQVNIMNSSEVTINNNILQVKTQTFLKNNKHYYITLDSGVLTSNLGCRLPSDEILDPNFWTFYVQDCINVNNCSGNGECVGIDQCKCDVDWTGIYCDVRLCLGLNNCSNNGVCVDINKCECDEGWTGEDCSIKITEPTTATHSVSTTQAFFSTTNLIKNESTTYQQNSKTSDPITDIFSSRETTEVDFMTSTKAIVSTEFLVSTTSIPKTELSSVSITSSHTTFISKTANLDTTVTFPESTTVFSTTDFVTDLTLSSLLSISETTSSLETTSTVIGIDTTTSSKISTSFETTIDFVIHSTLSSLVSTSEATTTSSVKTTSSGINMDSTSSSDISTSFETTSSLLTTQETSTISNQTLEDTTTTIETILTSSADFTTQTTTSISQSTDNGNTDSLTQTTLLSSTKNSYATSTAFGATETSTESKMSTVPEESTPITLTTTITSKSTTTVSGNILGQGSNCKSNCWEFNCLSILLLSIIIILLLSILIILKVYIPKRTNQVFPLKSIEKEDIIKTTVV